MIRVMIVADHTLMREGTRALLRDVSDINIVGESVLGRDALTVAQRERPDVIILDVHLPTMSSVDVVRALRQAMAEARLLVLTVYLCPDYVRLLESLDNLSCLLKSASGQELIDTVRSVHSGEHVQSQAIKRPRTGRRRSSTDLPTTMLSEREQEVLLLMGQGMNYKEVARHLNIGSRTVETHVNNATIKLGAHSRPEAIVLAVQRGMIMLAY